MNADIAGRRSGDGGGAPARGRRGAARQSPSLAKRPDGRMMGAMPQSVVEKREHGCESWRPREDEAGDQAEPAEFAVWSSQRASSGYSPSRTWPACSPIIEEVGDQWPGVEAAGRPSAALRRFSLPPPSLSATGVTMGRVGGAMADTDVKPVPLQPLSWQELPNSGVDTSHSSVR